ncbi:MAG: HEAT repeat domain-containing protein [Acidobacteriota bacterium]
MKRLLRVASLLGIAALANSEPLAQIRADLYSTETSRRLSAASRMMDGYPDEALSEFARILKAPAAGYNEELQRGLCVILARRGSDPAIELILRKQKEDTASARWVVKEALGACNDTSRISALIPGMLTNFRAADRELGFYLVGKLGLSDRKDILVKALAQERNREAFEQAVESAGLLMRKTKIASALLSNLDLIPAFEDRLAVAGVIGRSGDSSCVPALLAMLKSTVAESRSIALEALSLMKRDEALRDAIAALTPRETDPPAVPQRDRLRSFAMRALLRYPADKIEGQIASLLRPNAAFLVEDGEYAVDSRVFLLEWIEQHPDARFAPALKEALANESDIRRRRAAEAALAALHDPSSSSDFKQAFEKGDTGALVFLAAADPGQTEPVVLGKLKALMQAGLSTDPDTAMACIDAAGKLATPAAVEALVRVVQLEADPFSVEALSRLGESQTPEAKASVLEALGSKTSEMRRAACLVLARAGESDALKTLDTMARRDASSTVRAAAKKAADSIRARSKR